MQPQARINSAKPSSAPQRLAVLNLVGLSSSLLEGLAEFAPQMSKFAQERGGARSYSPAFPALTTTSQSDFLTGKNAGEHGIVGNGWYNRELCEIHFWKQPDSLVEGEKLWHRLRRRYPEATTAKLFWWYNMYSEVDFSITPRPLYPANGRKVFDIYTHPSEMRFEIQKPQELGAFPFPYFWGPLAGIESSRWIAQSAQWIELRHQPTLSLVYLPHLDYCLQKLGPKHESIGQELAALDEVVGELIAFYQARDIEVVILSEYGISPVNKVIYPNRMLREQGWLTLKPELGREQLDAGASQAFAVADHQIAHVYVNDSSILEAVEQLFIAHPEIEAVHTPASLGWSPAGVGAERAGDLILIAKQDAWFAWYHWLDDQKAPDFARTIDIHRKSGYDPCELFLDPKLRAPKLKIAQHLLKQKLGMRSLLEVIPLDASLVKGSHGHPKPEPSYCPVVVGRESHRVNSSTAVYEWLAGLLGC